MSKFASLLTTIAFSSISLVSYAADVAPVATSTHPSVAVKSDAKAPMKAGEMKAGEMKAGEMKAGEAMKK